MKASLILFASALAVLMFSCKKEQKDNKQPNEEPKISVSDYSQLHTGNYWIYERFKN